MSTSKHFCFNQFCKSFFAVLCHLVLGLLGPLLYLGNIGSLRKFKLALVAVAVAVAAAVAAAAEEEEEEAGEMSIIFGGIIALLLQDHYTMSTKSVCSSQYIY